MLQSMSVKELGALLAAQLSECTPSQQITFTRYRVPFYEVPLHRFGKIESALVVAHLPSGLLYFEDVEEGFEVAVLGEDGALPDQGCNQFEYAMSLHEPGSNPPIGATRHDNPASRSSR